MDNTKEKYISNVPMKDKPKIPLKLELKDSAVTTKKLADDAVTTPKIAKNAITRDKIADEAVGTEQIDDAAITTDKIQNRAIGPDEIGLRAIKPEHIDYNSVITDKIKDHNVTWDKLTVETQDLISAGTGADGNLIHDMEEWNNRIADLEVTKLNPFTYIVPDNSFVISNNNIIEWKSAETKIDIVYLLATNNGLASAAGCTGCVLHVSDMEEFEVDKITLTHVFTEPSSFTTTVSGKAVYKGVDVTFPPKTLVVNAVLPSYIGYMSDYNHYDQEFNNSINLDDIQIDSPDTGLTKLVKNSLAGEYTVTNGNTDGDYSHLCIIIPKNGNVEGITNIVQKGTLNAVQAFTKHEFTNFDIYVCDTAHAVGTYNFIIS